MRGAWTKYGELRLYFTYIMSNASMTLYTGVTNNLERRVRMHKMGCGNSFTAQYHFDRLVWFEATTDIRSAIMAEKRIKGWRRSKKIELITRTNPQWRDLSAALSLSS